MGGEIGEIGVQGVTGWVSSEVGRGPQVTLRVLFGCGVEVNGAGGVWSGSGCVGCCLGGRRMVVMVFGGRMGPLRMGLGLVVLAGVGVL